jgi:hypothetical protein
LRTGLLDQFFARLLAKCPTLFLMVLDAGYHLIPDIAQFSILLSS